MIVRDHTRAGGLKVRPADRLQIGACLVWITAATLAFIQPLTKLMVYAAQSELLSYIPLVPLVSGYILYNRREELPSETHRSIMGAAIAAAIALAAVTAGFAMADLSDNDGLALATLAYVALVIAGGFFFLGSRWMSAAAFPLAFLLFMVPLPDTVVTELEIASVLASADVSAVFFKVTGTPVLREGTIFALPTITLQVAKECSGIHSSWVLLLTSLLASNMFLKSSWRRILLVAFVIPLAIVRNAFRILVIGLLCVHIGPHMIDSVIHHRGGPLFFALSLVPLFALVLWLRRGERQA